MANVLNIGFDGTFESNIDTLSYATDLTGINNFIGTAYGTSGTYSNIETSGDVDYTFTNMLSNAGAVPSDLASQTNINSGQIESYYLQTANVKGYITMQFNNVVIRPGRVRIYTRGGDTFTNYHYVNRDMYASLDGTNWVRLDDGTLATFPAINGGAWRDGITDAQYLDDENRDRYWSHFRFGFETPNPQANNGISIKHIQIYGDVYRLDGGPAGSSQPVFNLDNVTTADLSGKQDGDYLTWQQGVLQPARPRYWISTRQTMSGTVAAASNQTTNFYILDPNGANRNFDLPTAPIFGDYFRVRNLNNSFQITVRESGPTTVTIIGGAGGAGLTQGDFWWDGVEWQAITY